MRPKSGRPDAFGRRRSSNAYTIRIAPTTTAQIPPTVMIAASVAPGLATARTPSGSSARPSGSGRHQSERTLPAAKAQHGADHDERDDADDAPSGTERRGAHRPIGIGIDDARASPR